MNQALVRRRGLALEHNYHSFFPSSYQIFYVMDLFVQEKSLFSSAYLADAVGGRVNTIGSHRGDKHLFTKMQQINFLFIINTV